MCTVLLTNAASHRSSIFLIAEMTVCKWFCIFFQVNFFLIRKQRKLRK